MIKKILIVSSVVCFALLAFNVTALPFLATGLGLFAVAHVVE